MKKVGYFFLFLLIYSGCYLGLLYIFTVILRLLSLVESIDQFLRIVSDDTPQFIPCFVASVVSMLLCRFLAKRLAAHVPALVFSAVVLFFALGLSVLAFVYEEPASMYLAHILPCLFMIAEQTRALRSFRS